MRGPNPKRNPRTNSKPRAKAGIVLGIVLGALGAVLSVVGWSWGARAQGVGTWTLFDGSVGVRAVGMGGAFVAVADGTEAVLFNPAGLAFVGAPEVGSLYELRFGASHLFRALGALPRWGGGLAFFSFGPLEGRNAQDERTETLGYWQLGLLGAGGWALSDLPLAATRGLRGLALGVKAALVGVSTVEEGSGGGVALGWGVLLRAEQPFSLPVEEMRFGMRAENLPGLGTAGPPRGALGIAVRPLSEVTIALDLGLPFAVHAGGEVQIPLPEGIVPGADSAVALRLGGFWEEGIGRGMGMGAFTVGFGLRIEGFRLDYAFQSHPQLPGSHRIGIAWRF